MTTRYTVVISETTTRVPGYGTSAQPAHGEEAGAPASRDPQADMPKQAALKET